MSRDQSEFAYLDTTSPGKLSTIEWQKRILKYQAKLNLTGLGLGIPGAGIQCDRHREEYKAYGISEDHQIMIDYDWEVHCSQKRWATETNFTGKVICGNLMQEAKKYFDNNEQVDLIDFDDVGFLRSEHEAAIRLSAKNDVKVFILVLTNRCNKLTYYHRDWKEKLGLEARIARAGRGLSEPVSDIHQGAIRTIANECGYESWFMPYAGRSVGPPMLSCLLYKK